MAMELGDVPACSQWNLTRKTPICRRNLAPYGERARVITGAAWHTSGRLVLSRGTFGDGRE